MTHADLRAGARAVRPRAARTSLDSYVLPFSIIHAENESALASTAASMATATAVFIFAGCAGGGRAEPGEGGACGGGGTARSARGRQIARSTRPRRVPRGTGDPLARATAARGRRKGARA